MRAGRKYPSNCSIFTYWILHLSQINTMWCVPKMNITFQPKWMNYVSLKGKRILLGEVTFFILYQIPSFLGGTEKQSFFFEMKWGCNLKRRKNRFLEIELPRSLNVFEALDTYCQIFSRVFLLNQFMLPLAMN